MKKSLYFLMFLCSFQLIGESSIKKDLAEGLTHIRELYKTTNFEYSVADCDEEVILQKKLSQLKMMYSESLSIMAESTDCINVSVCDNDGSQNTISGDYCSGNSLTIGATGNANMHVGVIGDGFMVPPGATIVSADIQFTAESNSTGAASLVIFGIADDNAGPFSNTDDILSRTKTAASATWTPGTWTAGAAGTAQKTTDLTALVQEIVDRPGYSMGNNIGFVISGKGRRVAESFDTDPALAPLICITYDVPDPPSVACEDCPDLIFSSLDGVPNFPTVDLLNVCSVPDTISLLVYNNAECPISNVQIEINFDDGLSYGGFVASHYPEGTVGELDVTDANNPIFLIPEIDSAGVFVVNVGVVADCAVDIESEIPLNFDASVNFSYPDTDGTTGSCSEIITEIGEYNGGVKVPVLNVLDVDEAEVDIETTTEPECQTITISQDGLQSTLSSFTFEASGLNLDFYSVESVSVNGIDVTDYVIDPMTSVLTANIDGQYFVPNFGPGANSDELFDVNEDLTIDVCYSVEGCTDEAMIVDYNVYYGCNNAVCGDVSSMSGAVNFKPNFGSTVMATSDNIVYGGICGADLSYDITIESDNTDPLDGLWQDLLVKYNACLGNGMTISGLQLNGVAVDAGLYTIDGPTLIFDFSTNTNPAYGLTDEDGGVFLNDLQGGQSLTFTTMIDISCSESMAACDGDLACSLTKVEVNGKRNCGQDFQRNETLNNPINFFYGEVSSSDNTTTISGYGIPITEVFSTTANVWNPGVEGYDYGYVFGSNNITSCANPGGIRMQVTVVAAGKRITHIRYEENSATYQGNPVANVTWMYNTILLEDGITLDTVSITIDIPEGDPMTNVHDYYFNLEYEGFCAPNDYVYLTYKVVEECNGCGAMDPCDIVRSCGTAAAYIRWNGVAPCPCAMEGEVDTMYRTNYGYADKAMNIPLTIDDVPAKDRQRFVPGDTMFIRTAFTIKDIAELKKSDYLWYLRILSNYSSGYAGKLSLDINNAKFLGWFWKDATNGTEVEIGIPDCFLNYDDDVRDNYHYPSINLRNFGVENYSTAYNPSAGGLGGAMNSYGTCTDDPDINPNYPPESAVNYDMVNISSNDYNADEMRMAIWWQRPEGCPQTGSSTATGTSEDHVNPCFDEFFIQFPMENLDTIFIEVKVPVMHNPAYDLDQLNGTGLSQITNLFPYFNGYSVTESNCSTNTILTSCSSTTPYEAHLPGPVSITNDVVVTDCDTEVNYTFSLENPVPVVGMSELPWYENEYRPFMATEYLEFQFPNNMVYLNDGVIIMPDGTEVTFPSQYVDADQGNLSCIDDGSGGICCVAESTDELAALRLVDEQYIEGRSLSYGYGPDGPNESGDYCDIPSLKHVRNDPFPHLAIGGPEECTYGIRYNLSSLCPEDIESSDFNLQYQFAEPYIPTLAYQRANSYYGNIESSAGNPYTTTSYYWLFPINPFGEKCSAEVDQGCEYYFQKITTDPDVSTGAINPMRQTGQLGTTPENFEDNSQNFPPLIPSIVNFLIADEAGTSEQNIYMVCAEDNGVDMATHQNVATSIIVPVSIQFIEALDENDDPLTSILVESTTEYNAYAISSDSLPVGECATIKINTELLFCPVGLDVETEICMTTTSGCINPAKAALFSAEGGACDAVGACYEYIAEEAEIQAEWMPANLGEIPLCTTAELMTIVKNVKVATLADIETMWWFPPGLNFVAGSWTVSYPGGPANTVPPVMIPDPTPDASQNSAYGTYFEYTDDQIWSSELPGDPVNSMGLPGVGSMADSNFVKFTFEVETVCDEFTSGTSIWFQADAADPCEQRTKSMFVDSPPIIIENANPANFPQFFVFADPIEANCGVESNLTLTYLNTSPLGETDNSIVCMDIEMNQFAYVPGSVTFISPPGHTPSFTESENGNITHICFDIPDGIGPGEAFQTGFSFTVPEDVSCGAQELGVGVASEIMSQECMAQGIECSVFVTNSVNPVIEIDFLPPVTVNDQNLTVGCGNGDGTVPMCYSVELLNNGAFYSNSVSVALIRDLNFNGQIDDFDTKLDSMDHVVLLDTDSTTVIEGCFNIDENLSCPVFLMVMQETNCVCDAQDYYYDSIEPELSDELDGDVVLCPGTPLLIENCGDYTFELVPAGGGVISETAGGDSLSIVLNDGFGENTPVRLDITSQVGGCQEFTFSTDITTLSNFEFGPFDTITLCNVGCKILDLNIPTEYANQVTVEWLPNIYLDDNTSLTPEICDPIGDVNYFVNLTFTQGNQTCLFDARYPIEVEEQPITQLFDQGSLCTPESATFVGPFGYTNYNWIKVEADGSEAPVQAGSSDTFIANTEGTYILEYYNVDDICKSRSTSFEVIACPIFEKTISSIIPTANANEYLVSYEISIENSSIYNTEYDLFDMPGFDDDIVILAASYSSNAGQSGGLMLPAPVSPGWELANDVSIDPSTTHTYVVTYTVSIDLISANGPTPGDGMYTQCGQGSGPNNATPGEALYNNASLDLNNDGMPESEDDDCGELPYLIMEKTIISTIPTGNNCYDIEYVIAVENLGGTQGTYDLVDDPGYDDDFTVNTAIYTTTAVGNPGGSLPTTTTVYILADDQNINASVIDSFTLNINVCLDLEDGVDGDDVYTASCGDTNGPSNPEPTEGLYNQATLDVNNDNVPDIQDEVCSDVPYFILDKSFVSLVELPNGTFQVVYEINVENAGGADGDYNLTDIPSFDPDIVIETAAFTSDVPSSGTLNTMVPIGTWDLGIDVPIIARDTHVYAVTVVFSIDPISPPQGGDAMITNCGTNNPGSPQPGEALYNEAQLDTNDDGVADLTDEECVPFEFTCEKVAGQIFYDNNNNGCQDTGENFVTDPVTVNIYQCVAGNNTGGTLIGTTTTIDGMYEFGLNSPNVGGIVCLDPDEQYYIEFDLPNDSGEDLEGYDFATNDDFCGVEANADNVDPTNGTSDCYDPSGDDDDDHIDSGVFPCQDIGGVVFYDNNNNGCQDPTEASVNEDITVMLYECNGSSNSGGTLVTSTTTINGAYEFGVNSPNTNADICLEVGTQYYVVFDIPNGDGETLEDWNFSTNSELCSNSSDSDDIDPSNGTSECYDPSGDDDDLDIDAGIWPCQEMGGDVFVDLNNNGCQDVGEENTTADVTVTLYQCDAGSNVGGTEIASTTTIDGSYEFGPESPNSDANVCLDPAETYYVVFDIPNGDGEALEDHFFSTNSDMCANSSDSDDVDPSNGTSECYDPSDDDDDDDVDAGVVPCQELGGDVFVDLNNNGCQDVGEENTTAAVTVTLYQCDADSNVGGTEIASTTTIDGSYEFGPESPNIDADVCLDPAETYYVVFDIPNGDGEALEDHFFSTNSDMCANSSDSDDVDPSNGTSECYDPSDDDDDDDVDAGVVPCQELGGDVFVDLNNNGCQDVGEENTTAAVTVTLYQCDAGSNVGGTEIASTTTIDGSYEFGPESPNIDADVCLDPAETYYVIFDIPNGDGEALEDHFFSTNSDMCANSSDSDDVDPSNGTSECYDPSYDDDDDDVDAGVVPCQELGGDVFVDLNNNGCQDVGEENTTAAVTVTLYQCDAGSNVGGTEIASTTTIDGSYEFGPESPNIDADVCLDPAETYYVVFDIPNGDGEALEDHFFSTNSDMCANSSDSDDLDPSNGTSECYDPSDDDDDDDVDAGVVPCQELGGDVFVDLNNNGCQDAGEENTTADVTVTLYQCDAGSNVGGTEIASTTTIDGSYEFGPESPNSDANVCLDPAETYYVVFDIPNGDGEALEDHFFSTNSDMCANSSDSDDVDPSNGTSECYDPSDDDDDEDIDAGVVPCQELGGDVFVDLNNNGCQDAGEENTTADVTVTLYQCDAGSNVGGTEIASTTTIDGSYEFGPESPNIDADVCLDPAETYYVVFDIPNGDGEALEDHFFSTNSDMCANSSDSDDVDPSNGTSECYDPSDDDDDEDIDAGVVPCQELGGDVFVDLNNNGCQDAGEENTTADVTVTLYQCDAGSNVGGTEIASTTTIDGSYEFGPESPNIDADVCLDPAETYYVVFDIPNGDGETLEDWNFSTNSELCSNSSDSDDIDPSNGTSECYDPSGDDDDLDIDAGIWPCQEMGGDVFVDLNNNGCQDVGEENTTAAVTVTLYQCDAGSNVGGTEIASTTTIDGSYEFGPESPNIDADVCLDPAETYYVVFDIPNGDGEALEDHFFSTNSDMCANSSDSDDLDPSNGTSECYDPSDDDDDDDVDAGVVPCQELGGDVFVDLNNNGCQDAGEENTTADVTVTLYQCDAGSNVGGTEIASTTTIDGSYEFGPESPNSDANVCLDPAETYYVVFDIPNGDGEALEDHFFSTNSDMCANSSDSDDVDPSNGTSECYDPSDDDDDEDIDAGVVPCQELGGDVFVDLNNNGCQDAGEENTTADVTVTLYQCDAGSNVGGTEIASTTTIDGSYEFGPESPNIDADVCLDPAETYYVVFDIPNGDGEALEDHFFSTNSDMCANSSDSDDVDPSNGTSECYDPSDDDDDEDIDAGVVPCQELGGDVFVDLNNNGCQDAGEENTTADVTVTLYQCDAGSNVGGTEIASTTTIDGSYEFGPESPNIDADVCLDPAETYYVVFDIPNGDGEALEDHFFSTNSDMCANSSDSDDVDPSNGTSECYDPSDDDDDDDVDAGVVPCQELGGDVFVDLNNNGCQDVGEENTTAAVTVTLYQCDAGSNVGGTEIASTTTIDGSYEFGPESPNIDADVCLDPAETYYVVFDIPNGDGEALEDHFFSTNSDMCANSSDSDDVDPSNGTSECYDPSDDDDDEDIDAGIWPCQEMGGDVFVDANGNGCQDVGEENTTADVTVTLYQCDAGSNVGGTEIASTTTIDGSYEFGPESPNIDAGVCLDPAETYYVVFSLPNGPGEALENNHFTENEGICNNSDQSDDVDPTTGSSECYDPSDDDDDDDVDAGITFYDLALNKTTNETGPFGYNDIINFDVNVFNQGSETANLIEISDYIPCGFEYLPSNNGIWSYDTNTRIATTTILSGLAPLTNTSVSIDLRLISCTDAPENGWTNVAEISNDDGDDIDSESDDDPDNDGVPIDNEIDGDGTCDDCIQTVRVPLNDLNNLPIITEVFVDGSVLALPNYPYDLANPVQAALFLSDCQALGYNVNQTLALDNSYVDIDVLYPGETFESFNINSGTTYSFNCHSCNSGGPDEDDHDFEEVEIFDLAFKKSIDNLGPYSEGDIAEFKHTVYNQGNVPAYNIVVTDYLNEGFIFNGGGVNSHWTLAAAYIETIFVGPLAPGDSMEVSLFLEIQVPPGATAASWVNEAEISSADNDTDPNNLDPIDVDSEANDDPSDDNDVFPGDENDNEIEEHADGEDEDDNDIAYVIVVGGLGDTVWKDVDGDGVQDPDEVGVPGVIATLTDCEGNFVAEQTTDENGFYFFNNLVPGDYQVSFDISGLPEGCAFTLQDEGGDEELDNDVDIDGVGPCTNIQGGEYDSTYDAGLLILVNIGDFVWHDLDGDGVQDLGEPGIPNVQVVLYGDDNDFIGSTFTDADGYYYFNDLYPGDYFIVFVDPEGYIVTDPNTTNDANDSDATGSIINVGGTSTDIFTVYSGEDDYTFDAGYYKCIPIGETVWYDTNMDDIRDAVENGINGLEVNLWKNTNGTWAIYESQYTSHKPGTPSDDGYYKFCAPPGTYYIEIILPPIGLVQARANVFNNLPLTNPSESNFDSDLTNQNGVGTTQTFSVLSGQEFCKIGAGFYPMATAGTRVWEDVNLNGYRDGGEPVVPDVLVEAIEYASGEIVASAVTDAEGKYTLEYLKKEDYYLHFTPPTGYGFTMANQGNEAFDSDVDHSNGWNTTQMYSLMPGQELINVDAGLAQGILPVEWLSLTADRVGDNNEIKWSTASEINSESFVIERMIGDDNVFSEIGVVKANFNTYETSEYLFVDEDADKTGVYYYRIRQVDVDGTYEYSNTVSVNVNAEMTFDFYPNPTLGRVNFELNLPEDGKVEISVHNSSGKLVRDRIINSEFDKGYHEFNFDLTDLNAGIYSLRIVIGDEVINRNIILIE